MAKLSQRDLRERNAFEWRIVALALDRLFFIIYLIIIIVALGSMFPWREVFELPKLAKTAGTKWSVPGTIDPLGGTVFWHEQNSLILWFPTQRWWTCHRHDTSDVSFQTYLSAALHFTDRFYTIVSFTPFTFFKFYSFFDKNHLLVFTCEAQLAWKCLFRPNFSAGDFDRQSRSHWPSFFAVRSGSLVSPCMQDCKSLCATVTICVTLVRNQTAEQLEQLSQLS